jgi:hypothetical protein
MMRCAVLPAVLLLAGCGAAQIGYTPTSGQPDKTPALMKPFNGGAVDEKGRYQVTEDERALSCGKLTGSMQVMISRLKDSANRPRPSILSTGIQAVTKPLMGPGADLDVDTEIKQARARLKAYNELLAEKQCKQVDIASVG